jgi:hypothetical protein
MDIGHLVLGFPQNDAPLSSQLPAAASGTQAKPILDKHRALAIKERRLIFSQTLKAVDMGAEKMKALQWRNWRPS